MASKKHRSSRSSRKPRSSRGASGRHGSFLGMRVEYKPATDADRKALLRVLAAGSTAPEGAILDWIRRETPERVLRTSLAELRLRAPILVRSGRSSRLAVTDGGALHHGPTRRPRHGNATIYRSVRQLPPGAESAVPHSEAKAMVWYLPFLDTPYDVATGFVGTVEIGFPSVSDATQFFKRAVASGNIEQAELRVDAPKHPRGKLVDEYTQGREYS